MLTIEDIRMKVKEANRRICYEGFNDAQKRNADTMYKLVTIKLDMGELQRWTSKYEKKGWWDIGFQLNEQRRIAHASYRKALLDKKADKVPENMLEEQLKRVGFFGGEDGLRLSQTSVLSDFLENSYNAALA